MTIINILLSADYEELISESDEDLQTALYIILHTALQNTSERNISAKSKVII
jgi:hypothetical protein